MNQSDLFSDFGGFAMACHEQPRQRLEHAGVSAASDTELLALMLQGRGTTPERAVLTASRLLREAGSLAALLSWAPGDYRRIAGISGPKGLEFAVIAEIGRRMLLAPHPAPVLSSPDDVVTHLGPQVSGLLVEKFWVLCLNRRNRLLKQVEISSGTATTTLAHPREVLRAAIQAAASAYVCCHNHPSGDPGPSSPDLQLTRLLREASRAVDIPILDHVILGTREHDPAGRGRYSFKEAGLL